MHHILLTRTIPTLFGTAALVAAVVGAVIQASPFSSRTIQIQNAEPDEENAKRQIAQILTRQTAAWNEGDLEKFMATYWKSKDLTFSGGGKTTRGWQGTLDRYRSRYAPPNEMGKLHFNKLEISIIEKNAALVFGRMASKNEFRSRPRRQFHVSVPKDLG